MPPLRFNRCTNNTLVISDGAPGGGDIFSAVALNDAVAAHRALPAALRRWRCDETLQILGSFGDRQLRTNEKQATLALDLALEMAPDAIEIHLLLARRMLARQRYPEAYFWAAETLRVDPAHHLAHSLAGRAAQRVGNLEVAVAHFQRAPTTSRKHLIEVQTELGRQLIQSDPTRAVSYLLNAVRFDPTRRNLEALAAAASFRILNASHRSIDTLCRRLSPLSAWGSTLYEDNIWVRCATSSEERAGRARVAWQRHPDSTPFQDMHLQWTAQWIRKLSDGGEYAEAIAVAEQLVADRPESKDAGRAFVQLLENVGRRTENFVHLQRAWSLRIGWATELSCSQEELQQLADKYLRRVPPKINEVIPCLGWFDDPLWAGVRALELLAERGVNVHTGLDRVPPRTRLNLLAELVEMDPTQQRDAWLLRAL